jgi:hypothetical protein
MTRKFWTPAQVAKLRELYPDHYCRDIARQLRCTRSRVYAKAAKLGLKKSAVFRERELAAQGRRLRRVGAAHRFPKGHVPANKGLRRPGWHAGRMHEHWFRKGHCSKRWDPEFHVIGALRVNADGYLDMRISFAPGALGWRALHLILWEDAHGPLPASHCLRFNDGEKLNVELDNLELITRAENCRRNSIHRLPAPLRDTIQLLGQLKRRINEKRPGLA